MPVVGIVAEYNPFHLGHAHQIEETRRRLGGAATTVCVMSGHWVQSADCAILDKWTRAGLALDGGADLVLELPLPWAISSAECFAQGALAVLEGTGVVDLLSFGSEAGALSPLTAAAKCLDTPPYRAALRQGLERGLSFASARQNAATSCIGPSADCLRGANNNLGVAYIKAIQSLHSRIQPMTVPRLAAGHNAAQPCGGFASATAIRHMLRTGHSDQAAAFLLPGAVRQMDTLASLGRCERAALARLRTMTEEDFAALPDSGQAEGLPARLVRAARQCVSLESFYTLAKTRRYSHARLRRLALWAFLGLTARDRPESTGYIRVLGANEAGRTLLRAMARKATLPILTKPAHARRLSPEAARTFELEARSTDLYTLCLEQVKPCGWEWSSHPVMR